MLSRFDVLRAVINSPGVAVMVGPLKLLSGGELFDAGLGVLEKQMEAALGVG